MIAKFLDHFEEIILVPGFAIMLIINFCNVLSRYVLHNSWAFTEELCVMMFVYVSFFGAAVAVKRRQHLGFTLIIDKLPPKLKMIDTVLISIMVIIFVGIMVYYGVIVCQNQLHYKSITAALRISTAYASACIPLSGVLIIIRTIQVLVEDIKAYAGKRHAEEVKS